MKKTTTSVQAMLRTMYLLFLMIIMVNTTASAQDSASRTTDKDPYAEFAKTNPDLPVVKLYLAHPDVPEIVRAYKNAVLVSNPSAFPEFSTEEIARRKAELQAFNSDATEIQKSMDKGMSYDIAKHRLELKKEGDKSRNQQ